jgi:hypothetical protein
MVPWLWCVHDVHKVRDISICFSGDWLVIAIRQRTPAASRIVGCQNETDMPNNGCKNCKLSYECHSERSQVLVL